MVARWAIIWSVACFGSVCFGQGQGLEGVGRVSLLGGWRLTPNGTFFRSAEAKGYTARSLLPGGPIGTVSFAYSPSDWGELSIDLMAGQERFSFSGEPSLSTVTYGALLGFRTQFPDWIPSVVPSFGVMSGPMLVLVAGGPLQGPREVLDNAFALTAGFHVRITESLGLTVDYRFMVVRGQVPEIGSIHGGGNWVSVGVCGYLPAEADALSNLR